jgi:hypothetical protein
MNRYGLLKSQLNEVFEAIKEAGMSPSEFRFTEPEDEHDDQGERFTPDHYPRLLHLPSKYWFRFGDNFASYTPGSESIEQTDDNLIWVGKRAAIRMWLGNLKREIDAPDLWASFSQEDELLSLEPTEAVNTPFSPEEQIQIKVAIEEFRIYITSTYSLSPEPLAKINRKLDYLIDASTRLGRIDWKNLFVGALISLALRQLSPSGPGLRELFGAAGHLLRHVLGGITSPPLLH